MPVRSKNYFILRRDLPLDSLKRVSVERDYRKFFIRAIGLTVAVSVALLFLPWQQSASGDGRVVAYAPNERQQEISAPVDARIKQWYVFEGQSVKAGDPIVELTDNDPEILDRLRVERDAMAKKGAAAASAVETAKRNMARQEILFKKGLTSRREMEKADLDYRSYLVDEAEASAALARMDIRLARQMTQSVASPIDGTILRVETGQGGKIVKTGQRLATIVPKTSSRAIEMWVNGNDMPLIREGAHVRIQFEGWPALQFSGWPGAAVGTFGGYVAVLDATDNGRGQFRIIVLPEGDPWPDGSYLRQGVRAKAWVLLNEVTLGFELWRLFNGFPPNMPQQEAGYVAH